MPGQQPQFVNAERPVKDLRWRSARPPVTLAGLALTEASYSNMNDETCAWTKVLPRQARQDPEHADGRRLQDKECPYIK